ncbi:MAG TPA: endonuclease/exonuclease/phosphatase family protein [Candidatus Krumholzibacteria bacterium]|nr:endonuclease/exonuclease/phosphatase family protein [Candidatus Krumholzibacteria bacterium]
MSLRHLALALLLGLTLAGCALLDLPRSVDTGGIVRATPRDRPATAPDSFHVVTWNVEHSARIDTALEEIGASDQLAGADVYLLQEIEQGDVPRLATGLGGLAAVHYVASLRERSGIEFGNTVLSRWPVLDALRIDLPGDRWYGSPRLATAVDLDVQGRRVRVVSLHTSTFVLGPAERLEQARHVLEETAHFDGPMVVGGDFNTFERSDVVELRALFRRYGFRESPTGPEGTIERPWRRWISPHDQLDHVFHRGFAPIDGGVETPTEASDHRPVWVRLRWPPQADAG